MFNLVRGLKESAFSSQPLTFFDSPASEDLSTCWQIHLLENGPRQAREAWQHKQLLNLIQFAYKNSAFWRSRLPQSLPADKFLQLLPVQTREDINHQVEKEGSLVGKEASNGVSNYSSSGSTGVPVKVFSMVHNARYNELRSIAQYLIEGRDLNLNRTFIKPADGNKNQILHSGIGIEYFDSWIGNLSQIFDHGAYKIIHYLDDTNSLIEELSKRPVGYLACLGSHMELLINTGGEGLIKKLGIKMWLHHSDNLDVGLRNTLEDWGILVRSTYSSAEVGPIAVDCSEYPGYYHVTHSNVIVQEGGSEAVDFDGQLLRKLLVTHLHSYATPIIQYEIGDYGRVHSSCPCGHDGSTLSHIFGRKKYFLRTPDNELIPFPIFSKPLLDITTFKEFFSYQIDGETIFLELGGKSSMTKEEEYAITDLIRKISRNQFKVVIKLVDKIDWKKNPKRLPFICYI
jgi:phenylacetate-CoA ligase